MQEFASNQVNSFDIFVISEDGTETSCGNYRTDTVAHTVPKKGFEAWCNQEVKSFRIEGTPDDPTNWNIAICSLGAFGSIYERTNPVTTTINIQ